MIVVNILISIPLHRRFLVLTITYKLGALASHPDEVSGAPPAAHIERLWFDDHYQCILEVIATQIRPKSAIEPTRTYLHRRCAQSPGCAATNPQTLAVYNPAHPKRILLRFWCRPSHHSTIRDHFWGSKIGHGGRFRRYRAPPSPPCLWAAREGAQSTQHHHKHPSPTPHVHRVDSMFDLW